VIWLTAGGTRASVTLACARRGRHGSLRGDARRHACVQGERIHRHRGARSDHHSLIVPAMFNLCLLAPNFETADLSHWRVSGYGGAIMPEATCERIAEKLPKLKLLNCYG
jgi:hypothetical protein